MAGHYSDFSSVLAGSKIYASILKTGVEALDQAIYDKIGGGAGVVDINGGTIDGVVGTFVELTVNQVVGPLSITGSGINTRLAMDTYNGGLGLRPIIQGRTASGTKTSPAATASGAVLFDNQGIGHTGSDWVAAATGRMSFQTTEAFDGTKGGTKIVFETTPNGSQARATALTIGQDKALTIVGALDHDGSTAGFFAVTPAARPAAYTQTYATATRTHSNITASAPPAGGTGATAGAYDTAAHRDAMIASLTATMADVVNVKQVVNQLIDDLQTLGLLQ